MAAPEIKYYTVDEFYADKSLPERCELIHGVVYDMAPAPNIGHQDIIRELMIDIGSYIRRNKGKCKVYCAPSDVKLTDDVIVQPDIYVTCRPDRLDRQKHNGAPDWVIEIVSPSSAMHDHVRKLNLYHDSGVREYWIADPESSTVQVFVWDGGTETVNTYHFTDDIPVHIYRDSTEKLSINISAYLE